MDHTQLCFLSEHSGHYITRDHSQPSLVVVPAKSGAMEGVHVKDHR